MTTLDTAAVEMMTASTNSLARSKKLPPPPLCLPATHTTTEDEKISNAAKQQRERKKSANNSCASSSVEECPHKPTPYVLPTSQRPQILETLMASSSTLLAPPGFDAKNRKSNAVNQANLIRDRRAVSKSTVTDAEWMDFMRLVVHKPLENELKLLLDKYKTTYFDRVNAPNASDAIIRSSLCAIATEALTEYSSTPALATTATKDPSPVDSTGTVHSTGLKRKRKNMNYDESVLGPVNLDNQTKFVISRIVPCRYSDNLNGNKAANQQDSKQFQKKYQHLFRHKLDDTDQAYLVRKGHLKNIAASSQLSYDDNLCLMLYDQVTHHMEDQDLEYSEISTDNSFTLSGSMLARMQ